MTRASDVAGAVFVGFLVVLFLVALMAAVLKSRRRKSKLFKKPNDEALLVMEEQHLPAIGKAQEAIARSQSNLVAAGDALLEKLSYAVCSSLKERVTEEIRDRLSEASKREYLTSERVRAAIAVAETSLAIESLMWSRPKRSWKSNKVVVYEEQELIRLYNQENPSSYQTIPYSYLIARINRATGANDAVSKELLRGIISLLREGKVRVPGLRAEYLLLPLP